MSVLLFVQAADERRGEHHRSIHLLSGFCRGRSHQPHKEGNGCNGHTLQSKNAAAQRLCRLLRHSQECSEQHTSQGVKCDDINEAVGPTGNWCSWGCVRPLELLIILLVGETSHTLWTVSQHRQGQNMLPAVWLGWPPHKMSNVALVFYSVDELHYSSSVLELILQLLSWGHCNLSEAQIEIDYVTTAQMMCCTSCLL